MKAFTIRTSITSLALIALFSFMCFACSDEKANQSGSDSDDDKIEGEAEQDPWGVWECKSYKIGHMLGVASHMEQGVGDDKDREFEFARYDELGNAVVREHFRWDDLEPNDDDWRFDVVDTQVQMAAAHHVKLLPQVGYDVAWAASGEGDSTLDSAEYGEFAKKVAERYCSQIKDYELWNEPDMSMFWEPKPDPQHYGIMVKSAYTAIKSVCPDARVSLGGMASYSDVDLFNHWWFLKALVESHPDIGSYFDVVSLHPYTFASSYSPENDWVSGKLQANSLSVLVQKAREILATIGKENVPIWFTEVGWTSLLTGEEDAANYLARGALLAARDNVEYYLWYTFFDGEPEPDDKYGDWSNYFGLFGWPGDAKEPRRVKPAWRAAKGLSQILGDACFAADLSSLFGLPNDVYAFGFKRGDGTRIIAAWDGRDMPDDVDGVLDEGGEDSVYDMTATLPADVSEVTVFDQTGAEKSKETVSGEYKITLTHTVVYITLGE